MLIYDFVDSRNADWTAINDVVMGGVSSARFTPTGAGSALFEGVVRLDHGGGFASVRSPPRNLDLSSFSGLTILARGDGKTYKLGFVTRSGPDGVVHRAPIRTTAAVVQEYSVRFEDFRPMLRGAIAIGAGAPDLSSIGAFSLLIGDRQEGPFQLEIFQLRAFVAPG